MVNHHMLSNSIIVIKISFWIKWFQSQLKFGIWVLHVNQERAHLKGENGIYRRNFSRWEGIQKFSVFHGWDGESVVWRLLGMKEISSRESFKEQQRKKRIEGSVFYICLRKHLLRYVVKVIHQILLVPIKMVLVHLKNIQEV